MKVESVEATEFTRLVMPHLGLLKRLAAIYARRDDRADLVQDTLARAWSRFETYDSRRGSPGTWLAAILRDVARPRRFRPFELAFDVDDVAVDTTPRASDLDLRRAVLSLPNKQRAAIILHYYCGLTIEETASHLGSAPGTVKSNLSDARAALGKELNRD